MMTAPLTDEDLVPRLATGDEAAVAELLGRYWERAYRVALSIAGGDPAGAEDVAQETFVEVLRSVERFEAGCRFRPWFFQVLQNTHRRLARGERRRRAREARAAEPELRQPADALAEQEQAALVQEHLTLVPPELRHPLALRYLEGLSLKEVAAALEIPEGTVSSRIRRGLKALRESLAPVLQLSLTGLVSLLESELRPDAPQAPAAGELLRRARQAPAGPLPAPVDGAARLTPALAALLTAAALGSLAGLGLLLPAGPGPGRAAAPGAAALASQVAARPGPVDPGASPPAAAPRAHVPAAQPRAGGPPARGGHWLRGRVLAPRGGAWVHALDLAALAAVPPDAFAEQVLGRRGLPHPTLMESAVARGEGLWAVPPRGQPSLSTQGGPLDPTTWVAPPGSFTVPPDGRFAFELPAGGYLVAAGAPGCTTDLRLVELPLPEEAAGSAAGLELAPELLRPLDGVTLAVQDRYGVPYGGTELTTLELACTKLRLLTRPLDPDALSTRRASFDLARWTRLLAAACSPPPRAPYHLRLQRVRLDGEGRVRVERPLVPGDYRAESYAIVPVVGALGQLRAEADVRLLEPRQDPVVLRPRKSDPHANLLLEVRDAAGQPQPGAELLVQSLDQALRLRTQSGPSGLEGLAQNCLAAVTDARGRYVLHGVGPGNYQVTARCGEAWGRAAVVVEQVGQTVPVTVSLGQVQEEREAPALTRVVFRPLDAEGRPLDGPEGANSVKVLVRREDGERTWVSQERELQPGRYEALQLIGPGDRWSRAQGSFVCTGGEQTVPVRALAEEAWSARLEGVADPRQAMLEIYPARPDPENPYLSLVFPRDGVFHVAALPPGSYRLEVRVPGYAPRTFECAHPGGQVVLDMGGGPVLTLRFRDPSGDPVAGVEVLVDGLWFTSAVSDEEGCAVLRGVWKQGARLRIQSKHYEPCELVPPQGGEDVELPCTLVPRGSGLLRGQVLDEAGHPLPGARVRYDRKRPLPDAREPWKEWEHDRTWEAVADDGGRFRLPAPRGEGLLCVFAGSRVAERRIAPADFGERELSVLTRRGGRLGGRVQGAHGERELLELTGPAGRPRLISGQALHLDESWSGRFESGALVPGRWTIRLLRQQPGGAPPRELARWTAQVEPGVQNLDLELKAGGD